jgi:hypothetical protein
MLTAVQSLRLRVRRGANPYGVVLLWVRLPRVSLCATRGYSPAVPTGRSGIFWCAPRGGTNRPSLRDGVGLFGEGARGVAPVYHICPLWGRREGGGLWGEARVR